MSAITLLDGGTSLELLKRSSNKEPRLWSAEYLLSEPELVRQVHLDYILAGAKIVTINTYSASYTRMAMVDEVARVPDMQRRACDLAAAARDAAGERGADVAIAGCIPPLNGTYRPDRVRSFANNHEEYMRLAELQAPHVDLFICETMSAAEEARAAATAVAAFGKPVWVGWTLADHLPRLRSGEHIGRAAQALQGIGVSAILANCSLPETISAAMPEFAKTGLACGGYANGFTHIPQSFLPGKTLEQLTVRRDLTPVAYADFALAWIRDGATIVGGCCEVGPEHIEALHDRLQEKGHVIIGLPDAKPD